MSKPKIEIGYSENIPSILAKCKKAAIANGWSVTMWLDFLTKTSKTDASVLKMVKEYFEVDYERQEILNINNQ